MNSFPCKKPSFLPFAIQGKLEFLCLSTNLFFRSAPRDNKQFKTSTTISAWFNATFSLCSGKASSLEGSREAIMSVGRSFRLKLLPSLAERKKGKRLWELFTFKVAMEIQIFLTSWPACNQAGKFMCWSPFFFFFFFLASFSKLRNV